MKIDRNYLRKISSWKVIIQILFEGNFKLVKKLFKIKKMLKFNKKIVFLIDPELVKKFNIKTDDRINKTIDTLTKDLNVEKYY